LTEQIRRNLETVRGRIAAACKEAGRDPMEVEIMAVTKQVEPLRIVEAWNLGVKIFGENRVQELNWKIEAINFQIKWNMIGQLQKNKVKYVINTVSLIQSLDRISLAEEINRQAKRLGKTMDVLVQVNIGKEPQKAGIAPEEALPFIETVAREYDSLRIEGMMAIAPDVGEEEARPYFAAMRRLFVEAGTLRMDRVRMRCLSMGMSGDYGAAVLEGATMVRLGSAIFGERETR